jgi:hypothetical protein
MDTLTVILIILAVLSGWAYFARRRARLRREGKLGKR